MFKARNTLKAEDLERLFVWTPWGNVEFGIFAEFHDRASKSPPVVDDDIPIAEYILQCVDIDTDRIILKDILQGLKSWTWMSLVIGGDILRF